MFRQVKLLYFELKQSSLIALIVPAVVIFSHGFFLALYLSQDQYIKERALYIFDEMNVILLPLAVAFWSYLFAGNMFERTRDILLIDNRHFLSSGLTRFYLPFLLLGVGCAGVSSLVTAEHFSEIGFITLRAMIVGTLCLFIIAVFSYCFNAAFLGLAFAVIFVLYSYVLHLGWLFTSSSWLIPRGGYDSLSHTVVIAFFAIVLLAILVYCERWPR